MLKRRVLRLNERPRAGHKWLYAERGYIRRTVRSIGRRVLHGRMAERYAASNMYGGMAVKSVGLKQEDSNGK
jgi:hypothetical protein